MMNMRMVMIGLFWASGALAATGLPDNLTLWAPNARPARTAVSRPGKAG